MAEHIFLDLHLTNCKNELTAKHIGTLYFCEINSNYNSSDQVKGSSVQPASLLYTRNDKIRFKSYDFNFLRMLDKCIHFLLVTPLFTIPTAHHSTIKKKEVKLRISRGYLKEKKMYVLFLSVPGSGRSEIFLLNYLQKKGKILHPPPLPPKKRSLLTFLF